MKKIKEKLKKCGKNEENETKWKQMKKMKNLGRAGPAPAAGQLAAGIYGPRKKTKKCPVFPECLPYRRAARNKNNI